MRTYTNKPIIIIIVMLLNIYSKEQKYKYPTLSEIQTQIQDLTAKYPNLIRRYDISFPTPMEASPMCGNQICPYFYIEITDFSNPLYRENPQVLLLAGIHGDEPVGVAVLHYLLEYIFENRHSSNMKEMFESKMIIIMPVANPQGFYYGRREEKRGDIIHILIDVNRDFPYALENNQCLRSASARAINQIFQTHLISAGITFHGGLYALAYPWGGPNHYNEDLETNPGFFSPDNYAYNLIADYMVIQSPGNLLLNIPDYPVGTLNNVIYDAPGTLEDWAYAASWESSNQFRQCDGVSETELNVHQDQNKALFFLIEVSEQKLEDEPITQIKTFNIGDFTISVNWKLKGCFYVDKTELFYRTFNQRNKPIQVYDNLDQIQKDFISVTTKQGVGMIQDENFQFTQKLKFNDTTYVDLIIVSSCDSQWNTTLNSVPNIPPQSHVVRSRVDENFFAQNNGYTLKSQKHIIQGNSEVSVTLQMSVSLLNSQNKITQFEYFLYISFSLLFAACVTFIIYKYCSDHGADLQKFQKPFKQNKYKKQLFENDNTSDIEKIQEEDEEGDETHKQKY